MGHAFEEFNLSVKCMYAKFVNLLQCMLQNCQTCGAN